MMKKDIVICACASRTVMEAEKVARMAALLKQQGCEVTVVPDLCAMAEDQQEALQALEGKAVIACHERAVRALLAWRGVQASEVLNLRAHTTEEVAAQLGIAVEEVSEEALKATEKRLDDAIAHAEQLERKGKVYTGEDWRKEEVLNRKMDNSVLIEKSDGKKEPVFAVQSKSVNELCVRGCSSYYARDFFNEMFK